VGGDRFGATRRRRNHTEGGARRRLLWRPRRGSVSSREKKGGRFYSRLEAVGRSLRTKAAGVAVLVVARPSTARCGRRRATASGPMAERRCVGQRLRGERVVPAYCLRPRHPYLAIVTKAPRTDRRSEGGPRRAHAVRRFGTPRRLRARRRACRRGWLGLNSNGLVGLLISQNF
jgi:hypothetical protein